MAIAVFGGGCFWCTEAVFTMLRGVRSVEPGYAGGPSTTAMAGPAGPEQKAPTYEEVGTGKTGHAEVIQVEYDPAVIAYRDLLTVFFGSHDPTTKNRQGNDVGEQYRSVILSTTEEQKREAEAFIAELNASSKKGAPIVTEIKPLTTFYPAEDYHRDYYKKNPEKGYCQAVINPKLKKVRERFAALFKETGG